MNSVYDINYIRLFMGYALMLIPLLILWYYKTGLVKDTVIAVVRMTIQLLLVGLYLEYIFKLNSALLNFAWVLIMTLLASYTIVRRSGLKFRIFLVPVLVSSLISILVTDAYFLGVIIHLDNIFDARYFIPITGMLTGNTIRYLIISMNSFYGRLDDEETLYRWFLANGAGRREALQPFMRDALKKAFNPMIANTAIMGLISLPGMMTGQILGGSNPNVAVKYQIMLMITIFSSGMINVIFSLTFANRIAFDGFGNLRKHIFREK